MTDTPNADQIKAEDEFVQFLLDPNEKEMRLIGPGGVGKSWLVRRLITTALVQYQENCRILGLNPEYTNYALTALTNKAAQSLQDATGLDVCTLQSWLSLAVRNNYQTGGSDLKRTANWAIKERFLIFIDETYMMDPKLYDELQASTFKCKIVYVGDEKQLDPVGEGRCPIRDLDVRTAKLTIPVRNSTSPALQEFCDILRANVTGAVREAEESIPYKWLKLPLTPGVVDHVDDAGLEAFLKGPMAVPDGRNLIVAFSNQRVNDYNNYLRLMRGQDHLFQRGEVLISNDLYERGKFRIRNEQTIEIEDADSSMSWLKIGDLDVPTQYVRIRGHPDQSIPVIIDRDFHKQALKYAAKRAKDGVQDWKPYFDLRDTFADFRPRDASTIHKAQGSTKDLILMDLTNIGTCNFTVMTARLLYVGGSRARHRIILYGNLPPKYGGVIF